LIKNGGNLFVLPIIIIHNYLSTQNPTLIVIALILNIVYY